jgi:hypothetical protein
MRLTSLLLLALVACDRPSALVICHNANCSDTVDPSRDDTIEALRDSLAVLDNGRPVIDGVEIDTFWRSADATCLYAHDLETDQTPALEPTVVLADHFATAPELTHGGGAFQIFVELKSHVSADKTDIHDDAELGLHARCAWDVYTALATAAVANGRDIVVFFSAVNPDLLRAVITERPANTPVPVKFGAFQGVPAPLDNQTRPIGDYAGIPLDLVEMHAHWILDAQYEAVRSLGVDLGIFMFSATVETFAVIEQYEPTMIVTNEARLIRRWLDR